MKKLVGVLIVLVIVLGGTLIFVLFNENGEDAREEEETIKPPTSEESKPVNSKETYEFQNIRNMKKATSIKEAFIRIFGEDRLFDDFKNNGSFNGEIKYYLVGVYTVEDVPHGERFKYHPNEKNLFKNVNIGISLKPGFDTRMEMIDFLHYLQYSGLTKPHFIKESLPKDLVMVNSAYRTMPDELPPFHINMNVYQQIKPGMNMPEAHQEWSISSDVVEVMDFSNKDDILNSIHMYGKFEGVNPSGMK